MRAVAALLLAATLAGTTSCSGGDASAERAWPCSHVPQRTARRVAGKGATATYSRGTCTVSSRAGTTVATVAVERGRTEDLLTMAMPQGEPVTVKGWPSARWGSGPVGRRLVAQEGDVVLTVDVPAGDRAVRTMTSLATAVATTVSSDSEPSTSDPVTAEASAPAQPDAVCARLEAADLATVAPGSKVVEEPGGRCSVILGGGAGSIAVSVAAGPGAGPAELDALAGPSASPVAVAQGGRFAADPSVPETSGRLLVLSGGVVHQFTMFSGAGGPAANEAVLTRVARVVWGG